MPLRSSVLLTMLLLLASCTSSEVQYPDRTPPAGFLQDPAKVAVGKALFLQKCASCHGSVEEGRMASANTFHPPPSDFTSPKYRSIDPAYLYWRIQTGKQAEPFRSRGSVMPAWGPHFSDDEIWSLVAYLRARPMAERAGE